MTATFRFYGELNVFVAPARRQRSFACACAQAATVKHMVEALGPPHTEVGLLLVNGEPARFERLLRDGDRVAVYPSFAGIDIGALGPPARLPPLRFIADAHLGGLARLLRMAGFDTLYDNRFADARIESLAIDEDRLVLTRDRALLKRRAIEHGCHLHALRPPAQLAEVAARLDLRAAAAPPFTLCLNCNAPLRAVAKAEVQGLPPPMVSAHQHDFTTCDVCRRVYWKGSHWSRMAAVLEAALDGSLPPDARVSSEKRLRVRGLSC